MLQCIFSRLVPVKITLLQPSRTPHGNKLVKFRLAKSFSTKQLTPTVALTTNGSTKRLENKPNLSKYSSEGKPLAILLCWLSAKDNAVNKFCKFYIDQGFDVLTVKTTPKQLILLDRFDMTIRHEVIPTLLSSDHEKKLIHGFSVGGYVFARMLKYMHTDHTGKCQELMKTINGQIWDSLVNPTGFSIGVSKSVFTRPMFLQKSLQSFIDFYLKVTNVRTWLDEANEYFNNKPIHAPALFLASEIDQISTINVMQDIQKKWEMFGIKCSNKVWSDTKHVAHMKKYPDEYKVIVKMFLDRSGFPSGARVIPHHKNYTVTRRATISNVFVKSI